MGTAPRQRIAEETMIEMPMASAPTTMASAEFFSSMISFQSWYGVKRSTTTNVTPKITSPSVAYTSAATIGAQGISGIVMSFRSRVGPPPIGRPVRPRVVADRFDLLLRHVARPPPRVVRPGERRQHEAAEDHVRPDHFFPFPSFWKGHPGRVPPPLLLRRGTLEGFPLPLLLRRGTLEGFPPPLLFFRRGTLGGFPFPSFNRRRGSRARGR